MSRISDLQERILATVPPSLRNLLEGGSRRELLKKIDATLLVYQHEVIHLETRNRASIAGAASSENAAGFFDASELAKSCHSLLKTEKESSILLLLPPAEFVATGLKMPGIAKDSLLSALKLQADAMLPAWEEELALAANPASAGTETEHLALWIPDARISELFEEFHAQELFLAAVKPRTLALDGDQLNTLALDSDGESRTAVLVKNGVVGRWLHVNSIDFSQDEFVQQFDDNIAELAAERTLEFDEASDFFDLTDKNTNAEYSFFPKGALSARKRVEKGKQALLAASVVLVLLGLSSIPFISQSLEFRGLARSLESQREFASTPRADQAVVVSFEDSWGAISDFPKQDIRQAMFTLQNVLSPDQLTSMDISEGQIRIQGTSSQPQTILQRLEQDPMFAEVVFSRATNNSRYYIDLRLSDVSFEAYMARHFPDE